VTAIVTEMLSFLITLTLPWLYLKFECNFRDIKDRNIITTATTIMIEIKFR